MANEAKKPLPEEDGEQEPCRKTILDDTVFRGEVKKMLMARAQVWEWRFLFCAHFPVVLLMLVSPILIHKFPGNKAKMMIRSEINLIHWIFGFVWFGCQYVVFKIKRCDRNFHDKDVDCFILYDKDGGKKDFGKKLAQTRAKWNTWKYSTQCVVFFCVGLFVMDVLNGMAPRYCTFYTLQDC
ncbi:unnamed protein product [Caenorhabditis brenneri]